MNKDINAIGIVRQMVAEGQISQEVAEKYFPELKESEGEKTKRLLHTIVNKMGQHLRDIFTEEEYQCFDAWSNAWLEKQGEKEKFIKKELDCIRGYREEAIRRLQELEKQGESTEINPSEFDSQLNRLLKQFKSLPKEDLASSLSFYLNVVQNDGSYKEEKQGEQKHQYISRPRYVGEEELLGEQVESSVQNKHWKPSKEQLHILESVIADYDNQGLSYTKDMLCDLYEQLKKL